MHESEQMPENIAPLPRLLPGERLMRVDHIPEYIPHERPSTLHQLQRLAQAKVRGEIGAYGPSMAALALERPNQIVSPELRKYEALFGRDSLRVALDVLPMYPLLMHATIHSLASLQGITTHAAREEEPGRIVHESRSHDDPIAKSLNEKLGWEWPYYGSVDATPQFMHAIYEYSFGRNAPSGGRSIFHETTKGRDGQTRTIAEVYRDALMWIENRLNANSEGLLEYKSSIPHGIENQVWRDSWDAYHHADGTLANRNLGIASVEVQQLVFDVFVEAAKIYETEFNDIEKAATLRSRADVMRESILKHFWVEEKGGYFALGTDRDNTGTVRPLKIRTSNMGHLLNSRLLVGERYREYREKIIAQLFSPEMLNVSGIRTLASDEYRFRPGAYHNGSVWLWDTFYCAQGLRRHHYYKSASLLANKIHDVINVTQKFPEYARGDTSPIPSLNTRVVEYWDENEDRTNTVEQPPQEVQAWSVAAEMARSYYSNRVPVQTYDARAVEFEKAFLAMINET